MSRLFDSSKSEPVRETPASSNPAAREALAAAELDDNAHRLGALLGATTAVTPVNYARERRGSWTIEHGRADDDYLVQIHPPKTMLRPWQDVITAFIAVMDGIFPRTVEIHYRRPDEQWQITFYTIRLENVCRLPGWEKAVEKSLDALFSIDASITRASSPI